MPADERLGRYGGRCRAGLVGGWFGSQDGSAVRENSSADAVVSKFGAEMFFHSGEEVETPLGVGGRGAAENVEVAFDGAVVATAALGSVAVVVAKKAASGREKVMKPFGDEHRLIRLKGADRGTVGGPGDVVPDESGQSRRACRWRRRGRAK